MHIGINAQLLSFAQNYRNSGVSHYIRSLLTGLAEQPGEHEYTVFVSEEDIVERLAAHHPRITYIPVFNTEVKPVARIAWEQFALPNEIRRRHIDVLHAPVNVLPEWLPRQCAGIVTLHDLAFLRLPDVLTRAKRLYHRTFTIRSLQRATRIITVSESTKRDVHELVGVPEEHIQTVYLCIERRFSNVPKQEQRDAFRQKQQLMDGFLLYLGTLEPRKNITTLIEAYARLRTVYGRREKLVLAGGKGWLYTAIFERVRQLGLESEVLFPGFVPENEQVLWYASASAFVYPSLYEGFGLPVAEALACGVPVVTSNVSSLPEAGAGIALSVDPSNSNALAEAIYTALTDTALQEKTRTLAPEVAQRFSVQTMVENTLRVYEQAATLRSPQGRRQRSSFVR